MTTARGRRGRRAIRTVGHSTRPIDAFLDRLRAQGIKRVREVRTIPRSRHHPQLNCETLPQTLRQAGMGDTHLPELSGLRHAKRDSPNRGWRNISFRGYADDMRTAEFEVGLDMLMATGERESIVVMSAVALPPFAACRCAVDPRNPGGAYSEFKTDPTAFTHDGLADARYA